MLHEVENVMLMVEHHTGVSDEEYECDLWREDQLRPAIGGCLFKAQTVGTGFVCQYGE